MSVDYTFGIIESFLNELLTSTKYDCFLEYGKCIHHLKTVRCDFPIIEMMVLIEEKGTQFYLGVIEIDNIRTQYYPRGRITDFTDLRPTRPTYIGDIILYTKRPLIYVPKPLDNRLVKKK